MADGLQPEMQGSPNPLILRNYRMIPPQTWKYYNLHSEPSAYPGQHIHNRDVTLIFKVEAAPIVLTYESELILKIKFLTNDANIPQRISNQWTPNPLYRIKAKSMAHIVKRCWATISNMTFQSYRPPFYLNEILLRKPAQTQIKYPDNYTGEKISYIQLKTAGNDPQAYFGNPISSKNMFTLLEPLSRTCPNEGQLYFMTPQFTTTKKSIAGANYTENTLTFRIPLTELLPVFKIGVIPLIMIASNSFDLWIDLYNPTDWFVDRGIGQPAALETFLNITTVSFPDINPLAETLIRPRIFDGRFIAPFLDYLTFDNTFVLQHDETQFFFNITQSLRNVPFISITFLDETVYENEYPIVSPTDLENQFKTNIDHPISIDDAWIGTTLPQGVETIINGATVNVDAHPEMENSAKNFTTGHPFTSEKEILNHHERYKGGFFSLPPEVHCTDVNILLGESAFPLTQVPISEDDMYMYNRKHFEMYGRDFNVFRVSPIGRAHSGDASFFFDLSHSPMTGFQIGPSSPLQITGKLKKKPGVAKNYQILVTITCYYSCNFNALLASGGVVPLQ